MSVACIRQSISGNRDLSPMECAAIVAFFPLPFGQAEPIVLVFTIDGTEDPGEGTSKRFPINSRNNACDRTATGDGGRTRHRFNYGGCRYGAVREHTGRPN